MRFIHTSEAERAYAEQRRREEAKRLEPRVAYSGPTLADLVAMARDGAIADLEAWIADELRARLRAAVQDAQACARTRPEYQHAVGFGHLSGSLEAFLAGAGTNRKGGL